LIIAMLSAQMLSPETDQASPALYFHLQIKHKIITKNYLKITINNSVLQSIFYSAPVHIAFRKTAFQNQNRALPITSISAVFYKRSAKVFNTKVAAKLRFNTELG